MPILLDVNDLVSKLRVVELETVVAIISSSSRYQSIYLIIDISDLTLAAQGDLSRVASDSSFDR